MYEQAQIQNLIETIENMLNRKIQTPKDFSFLSAQIFSRLKVMISTSTLKRIWGYLNEGNTPRESTLSILAQFAGYRNWSAFTGSNGNNKGIQSNLVLSRFLSSYSLKKGDRVTLTWLPDRLCRIEHLGECRFKVLESRNAKLTEGDTFDCHIFIEGEALYVDNLDHGNYTGISYIAGKKDGIRFEKEEEQMP